MSTKKFSKSELEAIVRGACLLSSGGGGSYTSGMNLLKNFGDAYYDFVDYVTCIDVDDIPASDRDCGVVIAYMGAPEAIEDLKYPEAAIAAAGQVKKWMESRDQTLAYVVPVEIGALSSTVACTVAAKLKVPVVDGDGAGRAVPELTMLTFASENISPNPTILSNATGLAFTLAVDNVPGGTSPDALMELVARPIISLPEFGQQAGLAIWIMSVDQIKQAVKIRRTLTACSILGQFIQSHQQPPTPIPVNELLNLIEGSLKTTARVLFQGKFLQAQNLTEGGFDHGLVSIVQGEHIYEVVFQNESLIAWDSLSGSPLAMAPDSIAYVVDDGQIVYSNDDLIGNGNCLKPELTGCAVTVIGVAANPALREKETEKLRIKRHARLASDGSSEIMKSFQTVLEQLGYYGVYIPLEKIQKSH